MKLKIFTDLSLLSLNSPVDLLIPFIGFRDEKDEPGTVTYGRFTEFCKRGKEFVELANVEECDVCLLPVYWDVCNRVPDFRSLITSFLNKVAASGKKIIIFASYDIPNISISVPNAIVFNSAISKSQQERNVFSWPHFFEDYLEKYNSGAVEPRYKQEKAVVGFCGYAPPLNLGFGRNKLISTGRLILNYIGVLQKFPLQIAHSFRARAVLSLRKSSKVKTNFVLKQHFGFDTQGKLNGGEKYESHADFRSKFVRNILNSDYTLCVRGIGNNSVRIYETLCCGRIPVFVNTDSVLPFDHIINWKELCVWVEEKDIDRIGDKISEFHRQISEKEFVELQQKLRTIWLDYLSPVGFFKHLHLFVDTR